MVPLLLPLNIQLYMRPRIYNDVAVSRNVSFLGLPHHRKMTSTLNLLLFTLHSCAMVEWIMAAPDRSLEMRKGRRIQVNYTAMAPCMVDLLCLLMEA